MLTQTIVMLAMLQPVPKQEPTAKQLIEKMLLKYYSAKTLTGDIHFTVTAQGNSASLDTKLQFEQPSKLYIFQQKRVAKPDPGQPTRWLVTSDGVKFSYDIPNDRFESSAGLRFLEPVKNDRVGVTLTYRDIFSASTKSLGDRSMPLDIAIAVNSDLKYRSNQWITREIAGKKEIRGKSAFLIQGKYRDYLGSVDVSKNADLITDKYQMAITEDGDLLQYSERLRIPVGQGAQAQQVEITNVWDVNFVVNGKVDPALFKVVFP